MTRTIFFLHKTVPFIAVCVLFFGLLQARAQSRQTLNNAPSFKIEAYGALPDDNYTIEKIVSDTTLRFTSDSLKSAISENYWVKLVIYNPYPNDEPYIISLSRQLNYTVYQYQPRSKNWLGVSSNGRVARWFRKPGFLSCVLQKQANNVLYLKINLSDIKKYNVAVKPGIKLEKEVVFAAEEQFAILSTIVCCIVLLSFSAYNLYVYFQLKDKAYFYYVLVQLGALIYLLSLRFLFSSLVPYRVYNIRVLPDGHMAYFDINNLFMHLSVTIIFCGFLQFARSYLCTRESLPVYDKILKMLSNGYILLEAIPVIITMTGVYFVNVVPASNVYILIMIAACLAAGIAAHKKGIKAAKYFLAANLLPLLFTACISVYILIYTAAGPLLPEIAILSQIFTFAVALVARIKLINEELQAKKIEAIQLENDIELNEVRRLLIEEENKNINLTMQLEKEKNEELQQKLEANQRELVGNSLYIHQKNKLLADLKLQIEDIGSFSSDTNDTAIKNIQSSLKEGLHLDDEWDKFKVHFEQVHPSFFSNLQAANPGLTKYELRLYAYFHINLSTKEIASLLNIAPASVRQAKARLNKKIGKAG